MLIRRIQKLRFDSLVVEKDQIQEGMIQTQVMVQPSFIQQTSNVAEMDDELSNLRIRMGVAFTKEAAQVTDFGSQRFNEYLLQEMRSPNFSDRVPENGYVDFLYQSLDADHRQYMDPNAPYSTFAGDQTAQNIIFRALDNISYRANGTTLPNGIVMYDAGILEVLPRDGNGNIIRRSVTSTRPGIGDEDAPDPGSIRVEDVIDQPIARNIDEEVDVLEQIEGLETREALQNLQRVSLLPVSFDMFKVTQEELSQLTIYMFIYEATEERNPGLTLEIGTTPIVSANILGTKTTWGSISEVNPYVGIGPYVNGRFIEARETQSPQRSEAQIIDATPLVEEENRYTFLYDKLYKSYAGTILSDKPGIRKIIKNQNYFTHLWITRDHEETPQFTFAFDLQSYLIDNSAFSYFYRNPTTANILIGGSPYYRFTPSTVKDMSLYRRYVDQDAYVNTNDLGTLENVKTKGPDLNYPRTFIMPAQRIQGISGITSSKIFFYEGEDKDVSDERREGWPHRLGYDVEFVVEDNAPYFLREVVARLYRLKYDLDQVFENIVNSVPTDDIIEDGEIIRNGRNLYDASNRKTRFPLDLIRTRFRGEERSYLDIVKLVVGDYQKIVDDIIPLSQPINIYNFFRPELTQENVDPQVFLDIQRIIDIGIFFFFKQLRTIFPSNPMGRNNLDRVINDFQSRGVCQRDYPIYQDTFSFNETLDLTQNVGYGTDYVFETEDPNIQVSGLTRISIDQYTRRIREEFDKYFQNSDPLVDNEATGFFATSATKHFTPAIFKVPNRKVFNQGEASVNQRPLVEYNLDDYASLFSDIMYMHYNREDLFNATPILQHLGGYENTRYVSRNEQLYDSIVGILDERYGVSLKGSSTSQYKPPQVSQGPYEPTADRTEPASSRTVVVQNGPLAIPAIIGGVNNVNPSVLTYLNDSTSEMGNNKPTSKPQELQKRLDRRNLRKFPIKLPFAIFGELSIDKQIDFTVSYERDQFNSMRTIRDAYGLTEANIVGAFNAALLNLPNQVKSMTTVATTNNQLEISDGTNLNAFSACRPVLEDRDAAEQPEQLVSFYENGRPYPPFSETKDPMKVYAKFLAFWMNYKQIAVVEYLTGFGNLNESEITTTVEFGSNVLDGGERLPDGAYTEKMKLDQWAEITPDIINQLQQGQKLLCRVRPLQESDYQFLSEEIGKSDIIENLRNAFTSIETLNLPMYNRYFFFTKGSPQLDVARELPEVPTVVNFNPPEEGPQVVEESSSPLYGLVGTEMLNNG